MPSLSVCRSVGAEVLAFLLAATCAGCGVPGTLLCDDCRGRLRPQPRELTTPGGLTVHAALRFDSVPARCIRRLKDDGETMLARPLGAALRETLVGLQTRSPELLVIPVPTARSSFRRRGYRVPELLIRRAGVVPTRVLSIAGGADQRGLDARERARNVRGRMTARTRGGGRHAVLVDDVVTTGATFDEARRALDEAGFRVVAAIALAATVRHSERRGDTSETRSK